MHCLGAYLMLGKNDANGDSRARGKLFRRQDHMDTLSQETGTLQIL